MLTELLPPSEKDVCEKFAAACCRLITVCFLELPPLVDDTPELTAPLLDANQETALRKL